MGIIRYLKPESHGSASCDLTRWQTTSRSQTHFTYDIIAHSTSFCLPLLSILSFCFSIASSSPYNGDVMDEDPTLSPTPAPALIRHHPHLSRPPDNAATGRRQEHTRFQHHHNHHHTFNKLPSSPSLDPRYYFTFAFTCFLLHHLHTCPRHKAAELHCSQSLIICLYHLFHSFSLLATSLLLHAIPANLSP